MKSPQWVLRETVLALPERLTIEFEGMDGLRDIGLIDSALARPRTFRPGCAALASALFHAKLRIKPTAIGQKVVPLLA